MATRPSSSTNEWYTGADKSVHHKRTVETDCTPVPHSTTTSSTGSGWNEVQSRRVQHRITYQHPPSWEMQQREQRAAVKFQGLQVHIKWETKIEQSRGDPPTSDTPGKEDVYLQLQWEDEMELDFSHYLHGLGNATAAFANPQAAAQPTSTPTPLFTTQQRPPAHHSHPLPPPPARQHDVTPSFTLPPPPGPPGSPPPPSHFYNPFNPHHATPPPALSQPYTYHPAQPAFSPSPHHPQPVRRAMPVRHLPPFQEDASDDDALFVGPPPTPRGHAAMYGPSTTLDHAGVAIGMAQPARKKGKGRKKSVLGGGDLDG